MWVNREFVEIFPARCFFSINFESSKNVTYYNFDFFFFKRYKDKFIEVKKINLKSYLFEIVGI
jgi:hypothetical protein